MPGAGGGGGGPRNPATRVGGPDWNRDPQVDFDPEVARAAREGPYERGPRPNWRDRMPSRPRGSGPLSRISWPKRIGAVLAVLVLLLVGFMINLDMKMQRIDAMPTSSERPSSSGTNWLLVGSDTRAGLTDDRGQELGVGQADGSRTDTMMIVHTSAFGQTSLVSLPRDSLVKIPGQGRGRLNSAYSAGGPQLLTETVEQNTGLEINHYAEIGFEGFSDMVDAVGGVDICLDEPLDDPKAGIDLPGGCQELDGPKALGFVRSRAFPNADLQRVQNQRKFLAALVDKAASPATLLNPFRLVPLANAGIGTLTVDQSSHVWHMARMGWAMTSLGGSGVTTTVPLKLSSSVSGAVVWDDEKAPRLWEALKDNDPVPSDLVPAAPR